MKGINIKGKLQTTSDSMNYVRYSPWQQATQLSPKILIEVCNDFVNFCKLSITVGRIRSEKK